MSNINMRLKEITDDLEKYTGILTIDDLKQDLISIIKEVVSYVSYYVDISEIENRLASYQVWIQKA